MKKQVGCAGIGSRPGEPGHVPIFVDLWRTGQLPGEKLVSPETRLDEINAAMDSLARGESIRQLLR